MSALRILVTGSRLWTDTQTVEAQLRKAWADYGDLGRQTVVVQGGARGADWCAKVLALAMGFDVEEHRADWDRYGKAAGHRRNAEMVALGADVCLAFPLGESRGTRGCMALAEKAGIPVVVHEGVQA